MSGALANRLGEVWRSAFGRRKPARETVERIKTEVRTLLDLPEIAAVAVNEILCPDPSCPGFETVLLVMEPGRKTRAYKVAKALDAVTEQDLRIALDV